MADFTIGDLPLATQDAAAHAFEVAQQNTQSARLSMSQLRTYLNSDVGLANTSETAYANIATRDAIDPNSIFIRKIFRVIDATDDPRVQSGQAWYVYAGSGVWYLLGAENYAKNIQNNAYNYGVDTGAANAYVVSLLPAPTSYQAGLEINFRPVNSNTSLVCTINVNGLGVKNIRRGDGTLFLRLKDLQAGKLAKLVYDGTQFQLMNTEDLPINGENTVTHVTNGGDLNVQFSHQYNYITIELDANINVLSFQTVPDKKERTFVKIVQNESVGYAINSVEDLNNGQGITVPLYSTEAGKNTLWEITWLGVDGYVIDSVLDVN